MHTLHPYTSIVWTCPGSPAHTDRLPVSTVVGGGRAPRSTRIPPLGDLRRGPPARQSRRSALDTTRRLRVVIVRAGGTARQRDRRHRRGAHPRQSRHRRRCRLTNAPAGQCAVRRGAPCSFTIAERRTAHVRHRHKYADITLPRERRFYFRPIDGQTISAAGTMGEFSTAVGHLDPRPCSTTWNEATFPAGWTTPSPRNWRHNWRCGRTSYRRIEPQTWKRKTSPASPRGRAAGIETSTPPRLTDRQAHEVSRATVARVLIERMAAPSHPPAAVVDLRPRPRNGRPCRDHPRFSSDAALTGAAHSCHCTSRSPRCWGEDPAGIRRGHPAHGAPRPPRDWSCQPTSRRRAATRPRGSNPEIAGEMVPARPAEHRPGRAVRQAPRPAVPALDHRPIGYHPRSGGWVVGGSGSALTGAQPAWQHVELLSPNTSRCTARWVRW